MTFKCPILQQDKVSTQHTNLLETLLTELCANQLSLDFMQMKLVNKMLRQAGAFYMRRTFGTDQLYKLLFTEYMKYLLCSSGGPIEFYIEGTRSRTAKSLHPKLGNFCSLPSVNSKLYSL